MNKIVESLGSWFLQDRKGSLACRILAGPATFISHRVHKESFLPLLFSSTREEQKEPSDFVSTII